MNVGVVMLTNGDILINAGLAKGVGASLISISGKVIASQDIANNRPQVFSVKHCAPGMYMLRIEADGQRLAQRKIVVR